MLERQIAAICGGGDPHPAALEEGKGRQSERLPSSERALLKERDLQGVCCVGEGRAGQGCLGALGPAGWEL